MLFLRIISWKGASRFNEGGGFIFKWGVRPIGGGGIDFDGGGRVSKKIVGWGGRPPPNPPPHPHYGKPCPRKSIFQNTVLLSQLPEASNEKCSQKIVVIKF